MKEYNPFYFIFIATLFLTLIYFVVGFVLYFQARREPHIKARLPLLTLITASGIITKEVLVQVYFILLNGSLDIYARQSFACFLSFLTNTILEAVIFWPLMLRFHYIHQVSKKISHFYRHQNYEILQIRARKYLYFLTLFLLTIGLVVVVLSLMMLIDLGFYQLMCHCRGSEDTADKINIGVRAVIVVVQISNFLFFSIQLIRYKLKTKYWIKQELVSVSMIWIAQRILFFVSILLYRCGGEPPSVVYYVVLQFLQISSNITNFTIMIFFPIWFRPSAIRGASQKRFFYGALIIILLLTFMKLNRKLPIQDLQWLIFQDMTSKYKRLFTNNKPRQIRQALPHSSLYEMGVSKLNPIQSLLIITLYIKSRYLITSSPHYCNIDDSPQLQRSLEEKYFELSQNLDEFLYEFLRPYLEEKLSPLYESFKESKHFKRLQKELEVGEVFEWVLTARHQ